MILLYLLLEHAYAQVTLLDSVVSLFPAFCMVIVISRPISDFLLQQDC